jgi:hypothetical protein
MSKKADESKISRKRKTMSYSETKSFYEERFLRKGPPNALDFLARFRINGHNLLLSDANILQLMKDSKKSTPPYHLSYNDFKFVFSVSKERYKRLLVIDKATVDRSINDLFVSYYQSVERCKVRSCSHREYYVFLCNSDKMYCYRRFCEKTNTKLGFQYWCREDKEYGFRENKIMCYDYREDIKRFPCPKCGFPSFKAQRGGDDTIDFLSSVNSSFMKDSHDLSSDYKEFEVSCE